MTLPGEQQNLRITDQAKLLKFIQLCFGQKRKTLRNNLRAIARDDRIREALEGAKLRPDARAEQLTLAQFSAIFAALT
jgi:16S rRNA (adenine1518-N6/adenine1519-N6)-dimethyltransferase